jgi:predicted phage terminase large subunit-like protein
MLDLTAAIAGLPEVERRKLISLVTPRLTKYIPHQPTSKQRAAMLLNHLRDGFYGGAAGGGKSDWLLMEALQYADIPGYSAIIFRRTFKDLALPGALMDRAKDWLSNSDARWNEQEHQWSFPSGATMVFGYLEHEDDKRRYQSAEFQFIGFDELTQFTDTQFKFMFSRLRRLAGSDIPLRVRGASNPGGPGHEWVKQRYIVEAPEHPNRFFISAKLQDNPHLDQAEYIESLKETDALTMAQMLRGDWDVVPEGKKFQREWLAGRIVVQAPRLVKAVRYWDLAASVVSKNKKDPDWTVGTLMGLTAKKEIVIVDRQKFRGKPGEVEERIGMQADIDGRGVKVWLEQEPGSAGVNTISHYRKALMGYMVEGNRSTGSKEERANPFFSYCQGGNVWLVQGPWINDWFNHLEAFPDKAWHDDDVDSVSGGFEVLRKRGVTSIRVM